MGAPAAALMRSQWRPRRPGLRRAAIRGRCFWKSWGWGGVQGGELGGVRGVGGSEVQGVGWCGPWRDKSGLVAGWLVWMMKACGRWVGKQTGGQVQSLNKLRGKSSEVPAIGPAISKQIKAHLQLGADSRQHLQGRSLQLLQQLGASTPPPAWCICVEGGNKRFVCRCAVCLHLSLVIALRAGSYGPAEGNGTIVHNTLLTTAHCCVNTQHTLVTRRASPPQLYVCHTGDHDDSPVYVTRHPLGIDLVKGSIQPVWQPPVELPSHAPQVGVGVERGADLR